MELFCLWLLINGLRIVKTQRFGIPQKKGTIRILQNEIKTINPDVLFINDIYSWHFSLIPLLFYKASIKIVSARGMLHPGALSQKYFKKKVYFALRKMLGMNKRCDFHASNLEEKIYIKRILEKQ